MLTEDEAREKWCPMMAMHADACDESERKHGTDLGVGIVAARCIGSACMAWRWGQDRIKDDTDIVTPDRAEKTGYCGLSGTPSQ